MLQKNVEWTSNVGHFDSVTQWQRLQANITPHISLFWRVLLAQSFQKEKTTNKQTTGNLFRNEWSAWQPQGGKFDFQTFINPRRFPWNVVVWHFDNYQKSLATRHAVSLVEFSESFTYYYCSSTITYKPIRLIDWCFYICFVALQFMCTDWEEIWSWMSRSRGKWTSVWTGRKCW